MIPMATNFRALDDYWIDAHIAGLASCLMLLQEGYEIGLIASSPPYNNISIAPPWGSNPLTDRLLSNDAFEIIHDGAAFTRAEKIRAISNWPQALRHLRVCWEGEQKDRNCCRCEKCIRTILNFRAIGLDLPACFEQDVTRRQIAAVTGLNKQHIFDYKKILSSAKAAGSCDSCVSALQKCIKQNERIVSGGRNLPRRIAKSIGFRRHLARMKPYIKPLVKWQLTGPKENK